MRQRSSSQWVATAVAAALFAGLPAFVIMGAFDCSKTRPGLHCTMVSFVIDDKASVLRTASNPNR